MNKQITEILGEGQVFRNKLFRNEYEPKILESFRTLGRIDTLQSEFEPWVIARIANHHITTPEYRHLLDVHQPAVPQYSDGQAAYNLLLDQVEANWILPGGTWTVGFHAIEVEYDQKVGTLLQPLVDLQTEYEHKLDQVEAEDHRVQDEKLTAINPPPPPLPIVVGAPVIQRPEIKVERKHPNRAANPAAAPPVLGGAPPVQFNFALHAVRVRSTLAQTHVHQRHQAQIAQIRTWLTSQAIKDHLCRNKLNEVRQEQLTLLNSTDYKTHVFPNRPPPPPVIVPPVIVPQNNVVI